VPGAPRTHRTAREYVTPAARRLRTYRSRRRHRWARFTESIWDYSWFLRQTLVALFIFLVCFIILKATTPALSGLRAQIGYYLTTDYDLKGATQAVFSGNLRERFTESLRIFPDLWERLTGGESETPPSEGTALILPVVGGTITSRFGYRPDPVTGEVAFHTGIDIAAEEGTPIVAALGGMVLSVDENESYGKMVEIDHGQGVVTLYAHASEITVSPGDTVAQGDEIGKVGMTGKATTPNCHFEVIVAGQPVDPLQFQGLAPGD